MNRSPLFYPMNRMDAEAGGAADLQTDVMRFMAIISMCLVAIFALVQSIPIAPVPRTTTEPLPAPEPVVEEPAPVKPAPNEQIDLTRPDPPKYQPKNQEVVALQRPVLKPVARITAPAETVKQDPVAVPDNTVRQQSTPSKAQKGFTLRFESDAALTRLVAQNMVGLYAITPTATRRMNADGGRLSFWKASSPDRVHEMDASTVPENVLAAFRRNSNSSGAVKWGVSLPGGMSRQLNQYLAEFEGGSLVIGLNGELRREQ